MQVDEERIEVRAGEVAGRSAPALFLWRDRLWSVRSVETRRAGTGPGRDASSGRVVLTEEEVWRVVAADGRNGTRGTYELTHALSTGTWRLSRVVE